MAKRRAKLDVTLDIVCIPMPKEHVAAWRAGASLLLQFMKESDFADVSDWNIGDDSRDYVGGSIPALLSVEVDSEWE